MFIDGPERRVCPAEFQDRLTSAFGTTRYGGPKFKIVWGQTNTIRMGNIWRDKYGNERREYREVYQSHCMPCWIIQRWKGPEHYGTPELYYLQNWDPHTKLFTMGEYPWEGRYETFQALFQYEFVKGKMVVDGMLLSHILIDKVIPLLLQVDELSEAEKQAAIEAVQAAEAKRENEQITEAMMANLPSFYGPVSFSRQGCRTSVLDKKMEAIQRKWDAMSRRGKRPTFVRGFQQGSAPKPKFVN